MEIIKTIKLYIGGKFVRTESGRHFTFDGDNYCKSSRKDFRNSVDAAKVGLTLWNKTSPFLKSQILYRMGEMCGEQLQKDTDSFVYYSGWCDKYQQLSSNINPVSGPFNNITKPEPMGIVVLITSDNITHNTISQICSILVGGNSLIVLLSKQNVLYLEFLSEIFATSDLPNGVVNLLSGELEELYSHIGSHMEVNAISYQNENKEILKEIKEMGTDNMKRIISDYSNTDRLGNILNFVEYKTIWNTVGV